MHIEILLNEKKITFCRCPQKKRFLPYGRGGHKVTEMFATISDFFTPSLMCYGIKKITYYNFDLAE